MSLITLRDVTFGYSGIPLFQHVDLALERGERIGLLGRNGAGKSTLMRLVQGIEQPTDGAIQRAPGTRVAELSQRLPPLDGSVYDAVARGLSDWGEKLARYHELAHSMSESTPASTLKEIDRLQRDIEREGGFDREADIDRALSQVGLDPEADVGAMSVGMKRRVLLARALVDNPDLLILDEPTNHLDIEGIDWLEAFLLKRPGSLLFVSHDRAFLRKIATRIITIDRGEVRSYACDYDTFLRRREEDLEAEANREMELDRELKKEEAWAKTGVKARRTRSQARVRALEELREERRSRRARQGQAKTEITEAERSGNLVVGLKNVTFGYEPDRPLIKNFETAVMLGDKIGLMGRNGTGKTTLLRLMLGELEPTEGTVRQGVKLEVAYFDQLLSELDDSKTVAESIVEGDFVNVGGRQRHITGFLQDFLFDKHQAHTRVKNLSGGERNRLLLARLFTRPSNVLVLDEPTNDLDAETIDLLEELLVDYRGTILFVSHDREFLNNVATSTMVLEGSGTVGEYVGGYDDWLIQTADQRVPSRDAPKEKGRKRRDAPVVEADEGDPSKKRLTWKEQQEVKKLPEQIEKLETERAKIHERMSNPEFYATVGPEVAKVTDRLQVVEAELEQAYVRWADLEERNG